MLSERLPLTTVPEAVAAFVDDVLPTLSSLGKRTVWCAQWREHPDAVTRLAAIADVWGEMTGADNADLHTFLRDVLDHHMPRLVDPESGAFAMCSHGHQAPEPITTVKRGQGAPSTAPR